MSVSQNGIRINTKWIPQTSSNILKYTRVLSNIYEYFQVLLSIFEYPHAGISKVIEKRQIQLK